MNWERITNLEKQLVSRMRVEEKLADGRIGRWMGAKRMIENNASLSSEGGRYNWGQRRALQQWNSD
jgi:hypothetical protein